MSLTVRPLTDDEAVAAYDLGRLAFGGPADPPAWATRPIAGVVRYGAFDGGRLVGKATDTGHEQWWGGQRLVAADVGGVAVEAEARGSGVGREVLRTLLTAGRERGAAVSALYPTVAAVYRALGWEIVGSLLTVELDTASLPRYAADDVRLRPGGPTDLPLLTEMYEEVARPRSGLLTRRGGFFDRPHEQPLPDGIDAITVAESEAGPVGVLAFGRGEGYGPEAKLDVDELCATTPAAARALVGVLAGWRTVTRAVRVTLLAGDAVAAVLPVERATNVERTPWMHRPVDVVRAVTERSWPAYVAGEVAFRLRDELAPWNSGSWRLTLAGGRGELARDDTEPDLWLTARGFAALYCGVASGVGLVQAGLAGGPADPAALDLVGCGPPAQLLDYF